MGPQVTSYVSNGRTYHPQERYRGHHHSYPATLVATYPTANCELERSASKIPRRKRHRAALPCNSCRIRKQRCDESRPCGFCKNQSIDCKYQEVPPPKRLCAISCADWGNSDDMQKSISFLAQHISCGQPPHSQLEHLSDEFARITAAEADMFDTVSPPMTANTMFSSNDQTRRYGIETSLNDDAVSGSIEERVLQSHYTGAHHLSARWPTIALWFTAAGVINENYVYQVEQNQGPLKLYGWSRPDDAISQGAATGTCIGGWSHSSAPADAGGTFPNGTMKLDEETVHRFHDSYMCNRWIMHPFIDPSKLREIFDEFIASYCKGWPSPRLPERSDRFNIVPSKLKHLPRAGECGRSPGSPRMPYTEATCEIEFEPTMENAIVLLVMALGSILAHDHFLTNRPAALSSHNRSLNSVVESSALLARVSTSSIDNPTPNFESNRSASSCDFSCGRPRGTDLQCLKYFANTDRVPGIAYFTQTTDILGNMYAGNDLMHAQAFLLAGLYYGQLARTFESWRWINAGCGVIETLLKIKYSKEINDQRRKAQDARGHDDIGLESFPDPIFGHEIQVFIRLFWSAMQLDSDIRVDFESLPANNMAAYANRMPLPQILVNTEESPFNNPGGSGSHPYIKIYSKALDVSKVHQYYLHQLELRKLLNRAHLALYDAQRQDPTCWKPLTSADADSQLLWSMLLRFRNALTKDNNWSDDDPPSQDINVANLRGKYYGAASIISRPFLYTALYEIQHFDYDITNFQRCPDEYGPFWNDEFESLPQLHVAASSDQQLRILLACKKCIEAMFQSTRAFDGLCHGDLLWTRRPPVTNISGTAAAQFSNVCVLAATYISWLHPLIPEREFFELITRTIKFLQLLTPLSHIFAIHVSVLEKALKQCEQEQASRRAKRTLQGYEASQSGQPVTAPGVSASFESMKGPHRSFSSYR